MPTDNELLSLAEAAVVAAVTVRDINRVIDERILPNRLYTLKGGRRLQFAACPMVGFYFHAARELTAETRTLLIHRLFEQMGSGTTRLPNPRWRKNLRPDDWTVRHGFLTVSLWEFATGAEDRRAKLAKAREMVVEDPEILSGTPVVRGTRIPVYDIAASVSAGLSSERLRSAYPALDNRMIELATIYAEAVPRRGRPRRLVAPPEARIVSESKVTRRRHA